MKKCNADSSASQYMNDTVAFNVCFWAKADVRVKI